MKVSIFTLILFAIVGNIKAQDIKLLFPNLYFGNEIDKSISTKDWYGLFKIDGTFYLKSSVVNIMNEHHDMVDDEGEKTGLQVTSNPTKPIILISEIGAFSSKELTSIKLERTEFYPNDTMHFNFQGSDFKFIASGTSEATEFGKSISNYKLFLESNGSIQLIGESDFFDEAMFNVFWAGDIDGDKQLDLIMDLTYKYSFGLFTLFLSSQAEHGELLRNVSQHNVYYD